MSHALAEKQIASGSRVRDVLQAAINSPNGLKIYVGRIGKNPVNTSVPISGTIVCFKQTDDMVGFAILHSGGLQRSYKTTTEEAMEEFLSWVESVNLKDFNKSKHEISPGPLAKFDCPNG